MRIGSIIICVIIIGCGGVESAEPPSTCPPVSAIASGGGGAGGGEETGGDGGAGGYPDGCFGKDGAWHSGYEDHFCGYLGALGCMPCDNWNRVCDSVMRICRVDPRQCNYDAECPHSDCAVPHCRTDGMCDYDLHTLIGKPCGDGGVCTFVADWAPPKCEMP